MKGKYFLVMGLAVALTCAAHAAQATTNLWISYYATGHDAYNGGVYADATALLKQAKTEGETNPHLAFTYDALGRLYTARGDYTEAEKALDAALCLKDKFMGPRSRTVPRTLNNLGDLQYIAGDAAKAETYYRQALDIHKTDQLNIEVCRSLNGLALIHADRKEFAEAEGLLKRALDIDQRAERRDDPYTATVAVNLAILYMNQGHYDQAKPLFDRAAYIQGKMLRPDHPDVALRLHAYAEWLIKTGNVDDARKVRKQADAIDAKWKKANISADQS